MTEDGAQHSVSVRSKEGGKWTEYMTSEESSEKLAERETEKDTVVPPEQADSTSQGTDGVPVEDQDCTYPEGGTQAWLTVFGAWSAMVGGLGMLNTIAPLQTYISGHQLKSYPESTVAWIFSIYPFILFFCSIQVGPIFDAYGPLWLTLAGSACLVVSMMLLGECTEYWHFVLDFSILAGLGGSLLLTPAIAAIGHFFNRRRGFATGIAMTGPCTGGIVFPLVFRAAYPRLGFSWATKILGFIMLFLFVFALLFLRSRLPRRRVTFRSILPDFKIFIDGTGSLAFCTAGIFFMELALFVPIAYITSYCVAQGISQSFSYQIVAILNAASVPGRAAPGFIADKLGRCNTMVFFLLLCAIINLCVWLPASVISNASVSTAKALAILYAILFGFASGSNLGLVGPIIGQLCDTREYGRYFATSYTLVSFATLIGIPIAGNLLSATNGNYWGLIVFTSAGYAASAACIAAVRVIQVGAGVRAIF